MDIFAYAIDMEKESEAYYRDLGVHCGNGGLEGIFGLLAEEEAKHRRVLENMRANSPVQLVESNLLTQAKDIFVGIKKRGELSCDLDQVEAYEHAREIEQKTRAHYLQDAEQATTQDARALFTRIADEELKHYNLLGTIIEFVNAPQKWLEDAEWNHLDAY